MLLRLAHEPNGDWYTWSEHYDRGAPIPGNTAATYVRAWRHVHALFAAAGAANVAWVWSPNLRDYPAGNRADRYYPGDDVVDWVGIDAYNGGARPPRLDRHRAADRAALPALRGAQARHAAGGGDQRRRQAGGVVDGLAAELPQRYPAVKAVVWFDSAEWQIDHVAAGVRGVRADGGRARVQRTAAG